MQDFRIIYKILRILQKSMDLEEFDKENLSAEQLMLSKPHWCRLMAILVNEGFITGVHVWNSFDCNHPKVLLVRPEITLKGLEYLEENSTMKKIANIAKGIEDVIPGI